MIIAVTGTPGTGKSELAERVSKKLNYNLIKINDFAREYGLILKHDDKRDSDIVDTKSLSKIKFDENSVIEGHLSLFINADIIIVLRCDPEELYKRLKKRDWSKDKIKENLESECLGLILSESLSRNSNVYEIDTTGKSISQTLKAALDIIKGNRNKYKPKVDYLEKITDIDRILK